MNVWYINLYIFVATVKISSSDNLHRLNVVSNSYQTKYFDTFLDHFSLRDYNATFKLRYLISQQHWRSGNAILFFCGNEDSVVSSSIRSGFLFELGQQLSTMVVFAEHRYYGESLPFGNSSFSAPQFFGYLSVEQALADYASLIVHLKSSIAGAERSAVIAFGGSYGGMLAAWLRQKYPNIVAGSLASSAPILMIGNISHCNYAYRILTRSFKFHGGESCVNNIRRLWPILQSMNSSDDVNRLSKLFRTCKPLSDVVSLMNEILNAIFEVGTTNYPFPSVLIHPRPARPVRAFCKKLSSEIYGPQQLLEAIFASLQVYYNHTGRVQCLPVQSPYTADDLGWFIQTCSELTLPMCTDGVTDMFYKEAYNKEKSDAICQALFNIKPRWGWINTFFGDDKLRSASNIIFSNGQFDPWAAGGIFSSQSDSIKIVRIAREAHHVDLCSSHENDSTEIKVARKIEKIFIKKWIKEWKD